MIELEFNQEIAIPQVYNFVMPSASWTFLLNHIVSMLCIFAPFVDETEEFDISND